MTTDPNSSNMGIPPSNHLPNGATSSSGELYNSALTAEEMAIVSQNNLARLAEPRSLPPNGRYATSAASPTNRTPRVLVLLLATVIMFTGLVLNNFWIGSAGSLVALAISVQILWAPLRRLLVEFIPEQERSILFGSIFGVIALLGFLQITGVFRRIGAALASLGWDAIGALGEVLGAIGQILIAILAVYVAWRQYIISRDLTIQQNTITQQQTIDAYFQGVSELVLDEEGLLEDWPQERAIAEGRTAAILSSVDASGKAKVVRFLSRARLLSPLRRDLRLGRAILDGTGGYEEDRMRGVRVIDLGVMLAGADLSGTDLRWTDLSEANLIRANLSRSDLVKANLARTILCDAKLRNADLNSTRFFYGKPEDATPRSRTEPPDYRSGKHTGSVIEGADFTDAQQMTDAQRYYCCAWGGSKTRGTIPGGCEGIPNKLGR